MTARVVFLTLVALTLVSTARAETVFIEAEAFTPSSDGWVIDNESTKSHASGLTTLNGAGKPGDATASYAVTLKEAGHYKIWVRYYSHPTYRGPFDVAVLGGGKEVASKAFDLEPDANAESRKAFRNQPFVWKSLEADLPAGEVVLRLAKHEQKTCSNVTRHIDCFLLTTDAKLVPDHTKYAKPTFVRLTIGDGYDRPVYFHIFADHYRAPWYGHFSISKDGLTASVAPKKQGLLKSGEQTPWCNISPMLYEGTGALLVCSARYAYTDIAPRLVGTLDFATSPDEKAIVRTIRLDCRPGGVFIAVPPDLTTPENIARLKTDREIAEETGKIADAFQWPTFGKKPERFPFLVSEKADGTSVQVDAAVSAREHKTLDYMGFLPEKGRIIHGKIWDPTDGSFSNPNLEKMKAGAAESAAEFKAAGGSIKQIVACMLTDEPTGKPASVLAADKASVEAFRAWLKRLGKTPADLLVADWDAVRLVDESKAKQFPALHYYTQRFRTRSLGDFMATQRRVLEEAYGGTFPILANFSDGAIYDGNFYAQGVDYFELLDADEGQNAVWSEDWASASSTYQCAAYNIELFRAATRRHGQPIEHFLIAYAGRLPWDVQLKAVGELARGVKVMQSFAYGPSWATHEGGPTWKSTVWYTKPQMWRAHAELSREIGAVEEMLLPAKPAPAEVAILYSSASDVWTAKGNLAYGFDRMHTWLALTHAQVPSDVVSETQVEDGLLAGYKVCYLSGPNLTKAAAEKLAAWVRDGGTLWLTAGAAARDEFDRPLETIEQLLPAKRSAANDVQAQRGSGRTLAALRTLDEVKLPGGGVAEVLSVRQALQPLDGAEILAKFKDGSPALLHKQSGKGSIYVAGFLPALSYVKTALVARNEIKPAAAKGSGKTGSTRPADDAEQEILARSANPWAFPAPMREFLLQPVHSAAVSPPIACDTPLVDAVYMTCEQGILVPLSNYTLRPLEKVTLKVRVPGAVSKVESARRGVVPFKIVDGRVEVTLPLDATDFVKISCAAPEKKK